MGNTCLVFAPRHKTALPGADSRTLLNGVPSLVCPFHTEPTQSKLPHIHLRQTMRRLGPILVKDAADDHPNGDATHPQTGAQLGFAMLWIEGVTWSRMVAIKIVSARIGCDRRSISSMPRHHANTLPACAAHRCAGQLRKWRNACA